MNPYEFNTLVLAMQMEIYDLERELETLQLGKDDNEEKELKIKGIQKKLDKKNKKMQRLEEIQLEIEKFLKKYSSVYRSVQIMPDMENIGNWKWTATMEVI